MEGLSNGQKLMWVFLCLSVFWILEGVFPLVHHRYRKWRHARVNLILLTTTIIINALFGLLVAGIIIWAGNNNIGLLYWLDLPLWVEVLFGVMILDLIAQYWVHYLLHRVKFMWKFHMVHHSDTAVDVTTGNPPSSRGLLLPGSFCASGHPAWRDTFWRICSIPDHHRGDDLLDTCQSEYATGPG